MDEERRAEPPPAENDPETIEILSEAFRDWKVAHPEGNWVGFWDAVAAGHVPMPH